MSSTGRGPRLGGPDDFYVTPSWAVERLLDRHGARPGRWLEPAAGSGAIIAAVNGYPIGDLIWVAVECRATAEREIRQHAADVTIADFLTWEPTPLLVADITTVITNPPFALCEKFIRRAAEKFPHADLIFLVRLGFLASEKRVALWRDVGTPDVYVLPNRPSFLPSGATDSADYCWIVLGPGRRSGGHGRFEVLDSTPASARRPVKKGRAA